MYKKSEENKQESETYRKVCYQYNKTHMMAFFENPHFAFLYREFMSSAKADTANYKRGKIAQSDLLDAIKAIYADFESNKSKNVHWSYTRNSSNQKLEAWSKGIASKHV